MLFRSEQGEVSHLLYEAAEEKIDAADLSPIQRFCDADYGKNSLIAWAHQKFGVDVNPEEFRQLSEKDALDQLRRAVLDAYKRREFRYPVEWILERTVAREGMDPAVAADHLAQWANFKYSLGWTAEFITGRPIEKTVDELFEVARQYSIEGKLEKEVDAGLDGDADAAEWGRKRFGPAFDEEAFAEASDKRAVLVAFGRDLIRRELTMLERFVLLQLYDQAWKDHMHAIDLLKEAIGLRGFAEQDPKIAYKREGFQMFQEMMEGIQDKLTSIVFKARLTDDGETRSRYPSAAAARHAESTNLGFSGQVDKDRAAAMQAQGAEQKIETIRREEPKVGRNDPCPCGSGKKFKQCHGKGK